MHKLLERQIKRFLGEIDPKKTQPEWISFLHTVSDTYASLDEKKELSTRSPELSSKEFAKLNERLLYEKEIIEEKMQERTYELNYEKRKLDEIAQNMAIGAILFDSRGNAIFTNNAAVRILGSGQESAEIIEKFFTAFKPVSADKHFAQCINGIPSDIPEAEYGDKIFKILFRCLSPQNSTAGHLVWIEDITEAKLLDRAKSEFVAIAAHEMRTPLSIIRGQAELLLGTPSVTASPEDVVRRISSIHNSSIRLLDIADDFLDLTQLEAKSVQFKEEEFDIISLLEETVSDFQKMAVQKNLSLAFLKPSQPPPPVMADKERVRQVIVSIVGNALHYTEKGNVEVSVFPGPTHAKIFVKDTGIGIEPATQHSLFQKFQITGKTFMHSREYGSGMGLYIAKMLVEHMGGEIKLEESAMGKGSTFSFTVPRAVSGVA